MRTEVKAAFAVALIGTVAVIVYFTIQGSDPAEVTFDNPNQETAQTSDARPATDTPAERAAPPRRPIGTTPPDRSDRTRTTTQNTPTRTTGDQTPPTSRRFRGPTGLTETADPTTTATGNRMNSFMPTGRNRPTTTTPPTNTTETETESPTAGATPNETTPANAAAEDKSDTPAVTDTATPPRTAATTNNRTTNDNTTSVPRRPTETTTTRPANARVRTHTVVAGDRLYNLAEDYYGNGKYWRQIAEANPDLANPNILPVGFELKLPPRDDVVTTRPAPRTATEIARAAATNRSGPLEYVVERGDNLTRIAENTLDDPDRWRDIYELNRDQLTSPDRLLVGMKLKIPPKNRER